MGGKALNKYGVTTERKSTGQFLRLASIISNRIKTDFGFRSEIVKCYHTKESHGDLDLLIQIESNSNVNWKEYIKNAFNPNAINCNGGVYSFDYDNFQIDIIPIINSQWEVAKTYYSYDPLGNIQGKTFHKFNLSYGWNGLYYKFRNFDGRVVEDILISADPRKIFEFADYDYDRYLIGFDTLEEIFEFVLESKYFDNEMFKFENLNHIDKKRNRKRGSYHVFLKYLENNNINRKFDFHKNKELYLPMINNFFPEANLMEKLKELELRDNKNKIISQKFNGDIVMSWLPNLKGKELGQAISNFKYALSDEYDDFILNASYMEIFNRFMEVYDEKG